MGPPSTLTLPASASNAFSGRASPMQSCSRPLSPREAEGVNARLVEELRSVVVMNDKWQKYHQQQQKYISELQESLEVQRSRTQEAEKRYSQLLPKQRLQENKIRELEETIKCFSSVMEEADKAKRLKESLEGEIRELKRLRDSGDKKGNDTNQLLQFQLQVCIDDFKKEEAEKNKLQKEVSSLSTKLLEANRLITEYREKVTMMKAIHFPSINQEDLEVNAIPKDNHTIHRRRNRVSTSAPVKSGMSCRLDGIVNFPTTVEADSYGCRAQKGFELAPKFSSSLGSGGTAVVSDSNFDQESLDPAVDLVRH